MKTDPRVKSQTQRAAEKGIDLLKVQQKWSILGPSLMSLVAEYDPQERKNG